MKQYPLSSLTHLETEARVPRLNCPVKFKDILQLQAELKGHFQCGRLQQQQQ